MRILNEMVNKTISIRDDQEKWIKDTSLNLSRFVQKKLDERMRITNKETK